MPNFVLATRLTRPFTHIFSKSLDSKSMRLRYPYLSHSSTRHWHTICTLFSFLTPHSGQSCCCVSPS